MCVCVGQSEASLTLDSPALLPGGRPHRSRADPAEEETRPVNADEDFLLLISLYIQYIDIYKCIYIHIYIYVFVYVCIYTILNIILHAPTHLTTIIP